MSDPQVFFEKNDTNDSPVSINSYFNLVGGSEFFVIVPEDGKEGRRRQYDYEFHSGSASSIFNSALGKSNTDIYLPKTVFQEPIKKSNSGVSQKTTSDDISGVGALYMTGSATVESVKTGFQAAGYTDKRGFAIDAQQIDRMGKAGKTITYIRHASTAINALNIFLLSHQLYGAYQKKDPRAAFVASFNALLGAISFLGPIGPFLSIGLVLLSTEYGWAERLYDQQAKISIADYFTPDGVIDSTGNKP